MLDWSVEVSVVIYTIKINTQSVIQFSNYEYECFFSRADLRESMVFHDRCLYECFQLIHDLIHFLAQFGSGPKVAHQCISIGPS